MINPIPCTIHSSAFCGDLWEAQVLITKRNLVLTHSLRARTGIWVNASCAKALWELYGLGVKLVDNELLGPPSLCAKWWYKWQK